MGWNRQRETDTLSKNRESIVDMGRKRRVLIPYHFGTHWDIIPNREGEWKEIFANRLSSRLSSVSMMKPRLVVSGDCMAAIACHRDGLPLVWMDAHGDFNTLLTTETGNIGGMPLAMLCGLGDQSLMQCCGIKPLDASDHIVHLGGSEFDDGEVGRMVANGVLVVSELKTGFNVPIHLHIDTDVINSVDLPSSIHPAKNGMRLDEFYKQLDVLMPSVEVLSIKTYDPRLDIGGHGEKITLEIIRRFDEQRTH